MFTVLSILAKNERVLCEVLNAEKYKKSYSAADIHFRDLVKGIKFRDLRLGDGDEVKRGDWVSVQYKGRLIGGREIESTESVPGNRVRIIAGGTDVVCAVSEGVIGMRVYGTRELLVPPSMHYEDRFPGQIMIYELLIRSVG